VEETMSGIFVNGLPLTEFVKSAQDNELIKDFVETVGGIYKTISKPHISPKTKQRFTHSRVRTLTPLQIKEEYKIMQPTAKTFDTFSEQVLAVLEQHGESTIGELSILTGRTNTAIIKVLSDLRVSAPEFVSKDRITGKWKIRNKSANDLMIQLKSHRKRRSRLYYEKQKEKKKEEQLLRKEAKQVNSQLKLDLEAQPKPEPQPEPKPKLRDELKSQDFWNVDEIKTIISEVLQEKRIDPLNLKIQVSGFVKVIFSFVNNP